jgi:hypothetical protein
VCQFPQSVEVKKTGAAFQRVERAKDGIDRVRISGLLLQHKHALFDVLQQFLGFAVKFAKQPASSVRFRRIAASSATGWGAFYC